MAYDFPILSVPPVVSIIPPIVFPAVYTTEPVTMLTQVACEFKSDGSGIQLNGAAQTSSINFSIVAGDVTIYSGYVQEVGTNPPFYLLTAGSVTNLAAGTPITLTLDGAPSDGFLGVTLIPAAPGTDPTIVNHIGGKKT